MLKGIAVLALLMLPGSFVVLGLACLHPGVREKAMTLLGLRFGNGLQIISHRLQTVERTAKVPRP